VVPRDRVVQMRQSDFTELAPGVFQTPCPPHLAPKIGVVRWVPAMGGLWQPVIQAMSSVVYMHDWRPELYGCSWRTAKRLGEAGFVEMLQPGPKIRAIVLESYLEHLAAVRADPYFWTQERLQTYQDASRRMEAEESTGEDAPEAIQPSLTL
jgi:hypothetical protein